jgi:hypothetical protein
MYKLDEAFWARLFCGNMSGVLGLILPLLANMTEDGEVLREGLVPIMYFLRQQNLCLNLTQVRVTLVQRTCHYEFKILGFWSKL